MPELRDDPLTGELVLLAPGRAARPHTVRRGAPGLVEAVPCPFCPGHEAETPPEVARVGGGAPNGPGWRLRAFPNLYPIVGGPDATPGATGAHEVVVLAPEHDRDLARLSDDDAGEVFALLRDRSGALATAGHAHVQVSVNHGAAAGASIAHPHAQILALDFVPPRSPRRSPGSPPGAPTWSTPTRPAPRSSRPSSWPTAAPARGAGQRRARPMRCASPTGTQDPDSRAPATRLSKASR